MGNNLISHIKKAFDNGQTEIQSISATVDMNYGCTINSKNPYNKYMDNLGNFQLIQMDMKNTMVERNSFRVSEKTFVSFIIFMAVS